MDDFQFGCAWKFSQSLFTFGIAALLVAVSGAATWSLIFAAIWVVSTGFLFREINKDLAKGWAEQQERLRKGGR